MKRYSVNGMVRKIAGYTEEELKDREFVFRDGFVTPEDFIPLAEETGLIVPIGKWVLKNACAQHVKRLKSGYPPVKVAVNLSVRQFQDEGLIRAVADAIRESGMDPAYSSLGYLNRFPFDKLKIDRSFICDLKRNVTNYSIVKAIMALAKSMQLDCIAEGVDSEVQSQVLHSMGCSDIQGF